MAPAIPGRCTKCGRTIADPGFALVGDSTNTTMRDNFGTCPDCGGAVQMLEGTFNVEHGAIEMLAGPEWSWEIVEQLKLRLKRAVDERATDAEAVRDVDPTLTESFERTTRGWSKPNKRDLLMALYLALDTDYSNWAGNLNAAKNAVAAVLRFAVENGHPPPIL